MSDDIKIISCFSYKGGAGRSTLALNVAPFLADKLGATPDRPLILVDMDVDSCGITFFFNLDTVMDPDDFKHCNVQALFGKRGSIPQDRVPLREHPVFKGLYPVGKLLGYDEDAAILCMPANPVAGGSLGYDAGVNESKTMSQFVELCEDYGCSGILFDSAVGDQLTAKWSNHYADDILCVMRPTQQFREGTARFFDKFDKQIEQGKRIILIPNVVPTEPLTLEDHDGKHEYPLHAKSAIKESFMDNVARNENDYDLSMVEGGWFGVPKVDRFMWQEGILRTVDKRDLTDTEHDALKCYKKIAEIICKD